MSSVQRRLSSTRARVRRLFTAAVLVIANLGVTGYYNGNSSYLPSSDSGGLLWGDSWNP